LEAPAGDRPEACWGEHVTDAEYHRLTDRN
jgi:hypothetical protein